MGLASGEHGVKALVRQRYASAVLENVVDLSTLHAKLHCESSKCTVLVDGNVMLFQAPGMPLVDVINYMESQLMKLHSLGRHLIVVFDEPNAVSKAKSATQQERDAQRKKRDIFCSEDLGLPQTDAYNASDIAAVRDVSDLIRNRATRLRLIDIVAERLIKRAVERANGQLSLLGYMQTSLTIDGVCAEGDGRAHGAERVASILSTNSEIPGLFKRASPIGEGDLKLIHIEQTIESNRHVRGSPFANTEIVVHWTIDTDSLLLGLIAEAERRERGVVDFTSILALRERGKKRDAADGAPSQSHYTVIDFQALLDAVLGDLFSHSFPIEYSLGRRVVSALSVALAMQGSDFDQVGGLRASETLDIFKKKLIPSHIDALRTADALWSGDREKLRAFAQNFIALFLREAAVVVELCGTIRKRHAASLSGPSNDSLLRGAWLGSYWSGIEFVDVDQWGFRTAAAVK